MPELKGPNPYKRIQDDPRHRDHILRMVEQACRWFRAVNGQDDDIQYNIKGGMNRESGQLLMIQLTVGVVPKQRGLAVPMKYARGEGDPQ